MKNKKLVPVVASKMGNCVVKGQGYETNLPFTLCPFTIFEFCTVYIYFLIKMNNQTNYKNKIKTCAYADTKYYIHFPSRLRQGVSYIHLYISYNIMWQFLPHSRYAINKEEG